MTDKNKKYKINKAYNKEGDYSEFFVKNPEYAQNFVKFLNVLGEYPDIEERLKQQHALGLNTPDLRNVPIDELLKQQSIVDYFKQNPGKRLDVFLPEEEGSTFDQSYRLVNQPNKVSLDAVGFGNNRKEFYNAYAKGADKPIKTFPKEQLQEVLTTDPEFKAAYDYSIATGGQPMPSNYKPINVLAPSQYTAPSTQQKGIDSNQPSGLPEHKLGGWMKKNAGGIAGGLMTLGGAALMATGVGAPAGAAMMAGGVGQIAGQVQQNNQMDMASAQAKEQAAMMEQQNKAVYIQQKEQELFGQPQMPMMAGGGMLPTNDYIGQSHNGPNGGIPVDPQGNPSVMSGQEPVGLVENGEVNLGNFIFSDKLKLAKGKKTFADEAKRIKNKYKVRLGKDLDGNDEYAKNSMNDELKALATSQEMMKMLENKDMGMQFAYGGNLPKYYTGGTVPPKYAGLDPMEDERNMWRSQETQVSQNPITALTENGSLVYSNSNNLGSDLSKSQSQAYQAMEATPTWSQLDAQKQNTFNPGSVAPAYIGAGASVLGNLAQLGSSMYMAKELRKDAKDNQVQAYTYTPEEVSFAKSREQNRARALDARREAMRTGRNVGGQNYADLALSFLAESNKGLSDQLIASEQQEELANVGARNQAQQFNNQMLSQTDNFNLQNKQMLQNQALGMTGQGVNNLISSVGAGVQHVAGAYQDRDQFGRTAQFMSENYVPITLPDGTVAYKVKNK